ncbi:Rbm17 protein [Capsaspora owczarzaki ATCC 30864]|uniref:Rbm17 protein n=1 Tax=Capsaspora owczarzaki (strain ATCC 30864) TaxID=595528 RepID=A0A0D2UNN3_CAPO3|nr:Rbm17 protein [Capsaspora owczarzaki ATCC 30864]
MSLYDDLPAPKSSSSSSNGSSDAVNAAPFHLALGSATPATAKPVVPNALPKLAPSSMAPRQAPASITAAAASAAKLLPARVAAAAAAAAGKPPASAVATVSAGNAASASQAGAAGTSGTKPSSWSAGAGGFIAPQLLKKRLAAQSDLKATTTAAPVDAAASAATVVAATTTEPATASTTTVSAKPLPPSEPTTSGWTAIPAAAAPAAAKDEVSEPFIATAASLEEVLHEYQPTRPFNYDVIMEERARMQAERVLAALIVVHMHHGALAPAHTRARPPDPLPLVDGGDVRARDHDRARARALLLVAVEVVPRWVDHGLPQDVQHSTLYHPHTLGLVPAPLPVESRGGPQLAPVPVPVLVPAHGRQPLRASGHHFNPQFAPPPVENVPLPHNQPPSPAQPPAPATTAAPVAANAGLTMSEYNERIKLSGEEAYQRRLKMSMGSTSHSPSSTTTSAPASSATASSGTVVERMMGKMGWKSGQGLGKDEQGISTPLLVAKTGKTSATIVQQQQQTHQRATLVVLLENMVGPGEVDDDLQAEVTEESEKFGKVKQCLVFEVPNKQVRDDQAVRIFIEFASEVAAVRAVNEFHGRFFGGRQVRASFFPVERMRKFDLAPP